MKGNKKFVVPERSDINTITLDELKEIIEENSLEPKEFFTEEEIKDDPEVVKLVEAAVEKAKKEKEKEEEEKDVAPFSPGVDEDIDEAEENDNPFTPD